MERPIAASIAVLVKDNQILLVRRANPPDAGYWGFPGGKTEAGETIQECALRELREETGVTAEALGIVTAVDALEHAEDGRLKRHFVLIAVLCHWVHGTPTAADDALETGWFALGELAELTLSRDVVEVAEKAFALAARRGA